MGKKKCEREAYVGEMMGRIKQAKERARKLGIPKGQLVAELLAGRRKAAKGEFDEETVRLIPESEE